MRVELLTPGLREAISIPASTAIIRTDLGTIIGVVHEWTPGAFTLIRPGDPDFAARLRELGVTEVTLVEQRTVTPMAALFPR